MLSQKENENLLNQRLETIKINSPLTFVFDFDELIIHEHFSYLMRNATTKITIPTSDFPNFNGLLAMMNSSAGTTWKEFKKIQSKIAQQVNVRDGMQNLLKDLHNKYDVFFLSSGVDDNCLKIMKQLGFSSSNIIASSYHIDKNKIIQGANMIITSQDKGKVIDFLKQKSVVFSVGHGKGDRFMMKQADMSVCFGNTNIPADKVVNNVDQLRQEVYKFISSQN